MHWNVFISTKIDLSSSTSYRNVNKKIRLSLCYTIHLYTFHLLWRKSNLYKFYYITILNFFFLVFASWTVIIILIGEILYLHYVSLIVFRFCHNELKKDYFSLFQAILHARLSSFWRSHWKHNRPYCEQITDNSFRSTSSWIIHA